ncbi:M48 family metalloprotease (plasmid) [Kribbella sp. GL6]|uniref:M48 family metalloprotease n=1 Tax=Kribbella sp. GL6 TaxID=3419765 RepID=UPI003CFF12C2
MNGADSNFPHNPPGPGPRPGPPAGPPPGQVPARPPVPLQRPQTPGDPGAVPAVPPPNAPQPLPPRPAAIIPPQLEKLTGAVRRVKPSAWVELSLAFPWLWWSWLSVQFLGVPWRGFYWIAMAIWAATAVLVVAYPRAEEIIAWRVYHLRPPSAGWESQRLGPAWWAVCTAAGVDPNAYRVWVHEGMEASAPITAGSTVAVTHWALYTLPPRHLEAALAHELAHHLAMPRALSVLLYWFTLPARLMGKTIMFCLRHHVLSILAKLIIGFLLIGVLGVWFFLGWSYYIAFMLSPFLAPFVVPWAARTQERLADRTAAELGYGVLLAEILTGREHQRAQNWHTVQRPGLKGSQPLDSARLRALEKYLTAMPQSAHQPRY